MSIAKVAIVCAFAGAMTAGTVNSVEAAPLMTNSKAMKAAAGDNNIVQVQWRRGWGGGGWRGGGWRGGGWGWRGGGWGVRRGWGPGWGGGWGWGGGAVAGALIGGAIASSAWGPGWGGPGYWGDPYGYYGGGPYYAYPAAYGWGPRPFYRPRFVSYGYYGRPFRPAWGYRYGWRRWGW